MNKLARDTQLITNVIEEHCVTNQMPPEVVHASMLLIRACLATLSGEADGDNDVAFYEANLKVATDLFAKGYSSRGE